MREKKTKLYVKPGSKGGLKVIKKADMIPDTRADKFIKRVRSFDDDYGCYFRDSSECH